MIEKAILLFFCLTVIACGLIVIWAKAKRTSTRVYVAIAAWILAGLMGSLIL